ncbi:MAG: helix-turn-helix domain-containing protein [Planctomycetes bacterium]|nr:helix-turn-helix domain-containing protein [Planctomycetota bacterium]
MSDKKKDRLSFQEACRELQISEDELEKLVADGEIASIKEGDTFYFKAEVISKFKKNRKTEPTIILSDEEMDLLDGVEEISLEGLELPGEAAAPEKGAAKGAAKGEPRAEPVKAAASGEAEEFNLEDLEIPELALGEGSKAGKEAAKSAGDMEPAEVSLEAVESTAEPKPLDLTESAAEDTVLNLDGLLEEEVSTESATPVPGTPVGSAKPAAGLPAPATRLPASATGSDDITLEGNLSDDTILDTDVLEVTQEDESFKLPPASEEDLAAEATASTLLRGGGARVLQMKRVKGHPVMTSIMLVTGLALLAPIAILTHVFFYTPGLPEKLAQPARGGEDTYQWITDYNPLRGAVESIADMLGSK